MTRKRFIKLAMSQGCSKRESVFAADYSRLRWGSYRKAWSAMYGIVTGRFHDLSRKGIIKKSYL